MKLIIVCMVFSLMPAYAHALTKKQVREMNQSTQVDDWQTTYEAPKKEKPQHKGVGLKVQGLGGELTMCPDGSYVKGDCVLAPDGTYK